MLKKLIKNYYILEVQLLMSIIYKLVGIPLNSDTKTELKHQDWDDSKKEITLRDVESFFESRGCSSSNDILKFITDSETMKSEKSYQIHSGGRQIFVFTMNQDVKNKLISIFQEHGFVSDKKKQEKKSANEQKQSQVVDKTLSKPIPLDEIKIDEKVIEESNNETIKLFNNDNFISLLRIYSENPDIYKVFSSYISSGNVILPEDRFNVPEGINVEAQLQEIKKLGIQLEDDVIVSALKKFKGHLNLTLRYLLYNKSIST